MAKADFLDDLIEQDAGEEAALSAPTDAQLATLTRHAEKLDELDARIDKGEQLLAELKGDRAKLLETTIPDIMQSLKLKEFVMEDGSRIVVDEQIHGSLTKKNEEAGLTWLKTHNHADIIRVDVLAKFTAGESERAAAAMSALADMGVTAAEKAGVHAGTLKAFLRQRVEAEREGDVPEEDRVPRNVFSIHERNVAKITKPKVKK